MRYDRDGDQHYDVISAFIKSIRGSDVDAALHYLARMIVAGEDPRFIARRLVVHASEDVGLADPTALLAATAAAQAVQLIGMPEARINLAQATIHLATRARSRTRSSSRSTRRWPTSTAGSAGSVPPPLRDGALPGAAKLGHAQRYRYPHDVPEGRPRPAISARRAGRPRLLSAVRARRRARARRTGGAAARRRSVADTGRADR